MQLPKSQRQMHVKSSTHQCRCRRRLHHHQRRRRGLIAPRPLKHRLHSSQLTHTMDENVTHIVLRVATESIIDNVYSSDSSLCRTTVSKRLPKIVAQAALDDSRRSCRVL